MFEKQILSRIAFITLVSTILLAGALLLLNPRPAAADGPTVTYDKAGRLVEADYGDISITYTYDNVGNLLSREIKIEAEIYLPLVLRDYGT